MVYTQLNRDEYFREKNIDTRLLTNAYRTGHKVK
jgi:hypothetical protein